MQRTRFEVLNDVEIERIHAASMDILTNVGVKVDYGRARRMFEEAGARVDEEKEIVCIPESLIQQAINDAPSSFTLWGNDPDFHVEVGGDHTVFATLGTPTHILDAETGEHREVTLNDVHEHLKIIDSLDHIHGSQMDLWPNDIAMTTIHAEAIYSWAVNNRKSFGMGCYGYLPTLDMMRMMAIVAGGKKALREKPRFFAICSIVSPLQMVQMQAEGLLICAEYGQPLAMSPEAIAGSTAPVTLAGLLAQQNANILAHIALAQIARPGTPVLYGTVSTITNMRLGTVALGSVETGLITAGSAQLARHYGIPCRSVGCATESKVEDAQAGIERVATLMPAVLAGVNYITCGGTLDATMLASHATLVLDDEIAGMMLRMRDGITVNDDTLALDEIREVNSSSHYLDRPHTVNNFRREHYIPRLAVRDPYETWQQTGKATMLDNARQRAHQILAAHQPRTLEPAVERDLRDYLEMVRARGLDEFWAYEEESIQKFGDI